MELNKNIKISLEKITDTTKHLHDGIEILFVINGSLKVEKTGDKYKLRSNDVILINNRDIHSIKSDSKNLAIILHIDSEFLQANCNEILTKHYKCNSATKNEQEQDKFIFIRQNLTEIMLLMFKKDPGYDLQVMSKIYMLINHIILNFERSQDENKEIKYNLSDRLNRILSYINDNFTDNITLKKLADDEFISIHYLSKLFKAETGVNFYDYITELRINRAVQDLIANNTPINKVALNSGFPNIQSFNREFKRRFDQTPSEYRKNNSISMEDRSPQVDKMISEDDSNLSELVKFMMGTNPVLTENEIYIEDVEIDFSGVDEKGGNNTKIIRIGKFENLNNNNVKKQLIQACKELDFEYIHFEQFFTDDNLLENNVLFEINDWHLSFEFIRNLALKPIVKIDLDYYLDKFGGDRLRVIDNINNSISKKLNFIKTQHGLDFLATWKFELSGSKLDIDFEYIKIINYLIKGYNQQIGIGLCLGENLISREYDEKLLKIFKEESIDLDFVSFESDPNKGKLTYRIENTDRFIYANYLKNQVKELRDMLDLNKWSHTQIFVTSFNTLGGTGVELAGSFFRAALILKTITNMDEASVVLSFWLSNEVNENTKSDVQSDYKILSLFLIDLVKRPVYFILNFIDKINNKLYPINDNIQISKSGENYYLIASNQYYYNPLYSIIENYTSINTKNINIVVKGMETGKYLVKKFVLDNANGGDFDLLLNAINLQFLDNEILSNVVNKNNPLLQIYELEIYEEFKMSLNISSNAVVLYQIKKIWCIVK